MANGSTGESNDATRRNATCHPLKRCNTLHPLVDPSRATRNGRGFGAKWCAKIEGRRMALFTPGPSANREPGCRDAGEESGSSLDARPRRESIQSPWVCFMKQTRSGMFQNVSQDPAMDVS
jgi:hypothetical protein